MSRRSLVIISGIAILLMLLCFVFVLSQGSLDDTGDDSLADAQTNTAVGSPTGEQVALTPSMTATLRLESAPSQNVFPTMTAIGAESGDEPDETIQMEPSGQSGSSTEDIGSSSGISLPESVPQTGLINLGADGILSWTVNPNRIGTSEKADIQIQIELLVEGDDDLEIILGEAPPSPTPVLGATPTPSPTANPANQQYVAVFPRMRATLGGIDIDNFVVDSAQTSDIKTIQTKLTTWTWTLKPVSDQIQGVQELRIVVDTPDSDREPNIIPIQLEVLAPAQADNNVSIGFGQLLVGGLGILALVCLVLGYRWWMTRPPNIKIFLSYRRQDSQGTAGRLHDHLIGKFGKQNVFMDMDDIEYGVDFKERIGSAISDCDVLLAVMGTDWLNIQDDKHHRRLDNPNDYVRMEIETALNLGKWVIPTLVNDATMPPTDQMPKSLQQLARHNAIRVRNDSFEQDVNRLVDALIQQAKR